MSSNQNSHNIMTQAAEKIAFNADTSKVLRLVINSLYTNKDIFLRELLSNASDACDKLRYLLLTDKELQAKLGSDYQFNIKVTIDGEKRLLTIEDNGIGMDREELKI